MPQRHPDPTAQHGQCARLTGLAPTPRYRLLSAVPFSPLYAAPEKFALVPQKLDYWGNNQYGDCVSAEEAFTKACYQPEIFISSDVVISWARRNGYLNGADLESVMQSMAKSGFVVGSQEYRDGGYAAVDYSNEPILQAALAQGPVKLGMASGALPSGAGNNQGWYAIDAHSNHNEDHSTALSGYGPAEWLYQQLGLALPSGVHFPATCYLFFTWSTLGIVSHEWIMGCVGEAWIRNPATIGVPPLPAPIAPVDYFV